MHTHCALLRHTLGRSLPAPPVFPEPCTLMHQGTLHATLTVHWWDTHTVTHAQTPSLPTTSVFRLPRALHTPTAMAPCAGHTHTHTHTRCGAHACSQRAMTCWDVLAHSRTMAPVHTLTHSAPPPSPVPQKEPPAPPYGQVPLTPNPLPPAPPALGSSQLCLGPGGGSLSWGQPPPVPCCAPHFP